MTETIRIAPEYAKPGDRFIISVPYVGAHSIPHQEIFMTECDQVEVKMHIVGEHEVYAEREVPDLPTKNGAVLYPHNVSNDSMLVRDEEGHWFVAGSESQLTPAQAHRFLQDGTHFIAFEGVK